LSSFAEFGNGWWLLVNFSNQQNSAATLEKTAKYNKTYAQITHCLPAVA